MVLYGSCFSLYLVLMIHLVNDISAKEVDLIQALKLQVNLAYRHCASGHYGYVKD